MSCCPNQPVIDLLNTVSCNVGKYMSVSSFASLICLRWFLIYLIAQPAKLSLLSAFCMFEVSSWLQRPVALLAGPVPGPSQTAISDLQSMTEWFMFSQGCSPTVPTIAAPISANREQNKMVPLTGRCQALFLTRGDILQTRSIKLLLTKFILL